MSRAMLCLHLIDFFAVTKATWSKHSSFFRALYRGHMMSVKTETIQKSYRILRNLFSFLKWYILWIFSAIYIFHVLGFQGPLRLGSEEDSMRYVLNLPLASEWTRKNVVLGYNGDAFSIFVVLCHFCVGVTKCLPDADIVYVKDRNSMFKYTKRNVHCVIFKYLYCMMASDV